MRVGASDGALVTVYDLAQNHFFNPLPLAPSPTVVFRGTLAAVNAALSSIELTFPNCTGSDGLGGVCDSVVTVFVSDQGNTGGGEPGTFSLAVPVNALEGANQGQSTGDAVVRVVLGILGAAALALVVAACCYLRGLGKAPAEPTLIPLMGSATSATSSGGNGDRQRRSAARERRRLRRPLNDSSLCSSSSSSGFMSSSFESGISSSLQWSDDGGSEGVNNVDGSIGTGSGGDLLTETLATTNTTITAGTTDGGDYSRDVAHTPFYVTISDE